jgi:AcrR family transcriptional regulator
MLCCAHGRAADSAAEALDGEQTHAAILETAMRVASIEGLGGLTIGRLASELGVSKSGVYAHFRSKQRLQQETVEAARAVFAGEVIEPGMHAPEGLGQLEGLCAAFLSYVEREVFPGGCFFAQVIAEFDARSGALHEEVAADQRDWLSLLEDRARAARDRGELHAATDVEQLAFELTAALELANYLATLHRDPALVERGRRAVQEALARAGAGR